MTILRIATESESITARKFIDSSKGHSCIHCEYSDCEVTVTRDAAYDVIASFKNNTPIDVINHPNSWSFFPSLFS
jgi:hypothetical protein